MRKTDLYLLEYIQTEMSQSQIMPQMIQYTVFYDALGHKAAHRAASVCCAVHPCCKVRICLEYDDHLVGNGHVAVFTPLALEDEQLLAVKADVVPSEAACLADPEGAVVDDGKQGFVVQGAVAEKAGNLFLGEHSRQSLRLAHGREYETSRLLKPHHLVVGLQSENHVLEEGQAATVFVQECRQIVVDVRLCELIRQLFEEQHCLSNFQAIVIDTAVCILCQTQLFSKKRNAVPEFGYSRNCLVQCIIGHGERGWRGLMTGGFAVSRHLPPPFIET